MQQVKGSWQWGIGRRQTNNTWTLGCAMVISLALATSAAAGPGGGTLVVSVPAGDYSLWLEYRDASGNAQSTAPVKASGAKVALDLAPLGPQFSAVTLVALDGATGNAAVKPVSPKPGATTEVALASAEVNAVGILRIRVLGADRQPVSSGSVALTDAKGHTQTRPILAGRDGTVEFECVPFGRAKMKVLFADGSTLEQDIEVKPDHPPGALVYEVSQAGPVGAPPSNAPPAVNAPAAPTEMPVAPSNAPANVPATRTPSGPGPIGTLVGLLLLAVIGYVVWRVISQRQIKLDDIMKRLGVEVPAPQPATQTPKSASAPAPSVPEGHCPFCGQPKDPVTGACACTVAPTGGQPAVGPGAAAPPSAAGISAGPRLIVIYGPHLGASFTLTGDTATIGRSAESSIPLSQDNTVSRRHASLTRQGEGFVLRDEGSANGTYVNGLRITERVLQPGDEIQVGNTRMRFEGP